MTPVVPKNAKGLGEVMAWDELARTGTLRESQKGTTKFRLLRATLDQPPTTVGENAGGTERVSLLTEARSDMGTDHARSNPHVPGSRQYVGAQMGEKKTAVMTKKQPTNMARFDAKPTSAASQTLINAMNTIIQR